MTGPLMLPQFQGSLYDIQRKQALAQALMQQSQESAQLPNYPGARLSPWAGVNKVLQAAAGAYFGNQAAQDMGNLGQQQYGALMNMFGASGEQPSQLQVPAGSPPDTADGFTPPQPVQQGNPQAPAPSGGGTLRIPGMAPQAAAMAYLLNPDEYTKAALAQYSPTDATKMAMAAGLDPAQANAAALAKSNYIAPVEARPGTIVRNPLTMQPMAFNPQVPQGGTPLFDASGNVAAINQLPGAAQVEGTMAAAKEAGTGSQIPFSGVDANGNPLPVTNRTQAATGSTAPLRANNPGALMPGGQLAHYDTPQQGLAAIDNNLASYGQKGVNTLAGVISKWAPPNENNTQAYIADVSKRLGLDPNQKIDLSNPIVRHTIATGIMLHENGPGAVFGAAGSGSPQTPSQGQPIYSAPPLGAAQGATNAQQELSSKWSALTAANSQAQTTTSYLQNIKSLAQQAIVGPASSKLGFANGLLSLVSQKAQDTQTANDLLNKYGNQIVARLGQGNLGTDAARSLLAAANPNSHMTQAAINEAADNLVAVNKMTQAKAAYLMPPANARQPAQYAQREQVFDQYADPRVWQYIGIQNPTQRAAFARQAVAQDPQFANRLQVLDNLGVLR